MNFVLGKKCFRTSRKKTICIQIHSLVITLRGLFNNVNDEVHFPGTLNYAVVSLIVIGTITNEHAYYLFLNPVFRLYRNIVYKYIL